MAARALSLNLTGGMRLVGTQARECPPLFRAHRSVSALIIIKPSLPQIKARGLGLDLPLSHKAEEELTGLPARASCGKKFTVFTQSFINSSALYAAFYLLFYSLFLYCEVYYIASMMKIIIRIMLNLL